MNDQTDKATKTKSWITLGGGALIALIPFVGLVMWLLFLPIVILVGRWGYRIIGTGDTKGGLIHIGAALLFVPFAFVAPMISSALMSDLLWPTPPNNASNSSGGSADSSQVQISAEKTSVSIEPTAEGTLKTWSKLMTVLNAMKEFSNSNMGFMLEGKDYLTVDGTMDLSIQAFSTVGQIKTDGADPELATFMKRMSEEGIDVFQQLKRLMQIGRAAGPNVSQADANAYAQAVAVQFRRIGTLDQNLNYLHGQLTQKYGPGFESPSLGKN